MKQTILLMLGAALLAPVSSALAVDDKAPVSKPIRVLAGIFSASNGTNKQRTSVGVGYDFMKTTMKNPITYGAYVDYNTKKVAGVNLTMTGIGVSGRYYLDSGDAVGKSYATAGIGSYTVKAGTSKSKIGGKVGIGHELANGFLAEVDYTSVQKIGGKDPGGINARVGYRF